MNRTLWMTMAAFAIMGVASTALPAASACYVYEQNYVDHVITYVCTGEALRDGASTVSYAAEETFETIQFIQDTYGDDLP